MNKLAYTIQKPFRYRQFNAVYILIGINVGMFFLSLILNSILIRAWQLPKGSSPVTTLLGLSWEGVTQLFGFWQFFTYMFMHDLRSVFHILFNMLVLYMIGKPLEKKLGSSEFLLYYLLTGILAGLTHFGLGGLAVLVGRFQGFENFSSFANIPLVGASGAIFAILLAFGVYFSEMVIYVFGLIPMKARTAVLIFGGFEIINLLPGIGREGVSNITHIGGLVAGWLFLLIRKRINPAKVLFKTNRY